MIVKKAALMNIGTFLLNNSTCTISACKFQTMNCRAEEFKIRDLRGVYDVDLGSSVGEFFGVLLELVSLDGINRLQKHGRWKEQAIEAIQQRVEPSFAPFQFSHAIGFIITYVLLLF